MDSRDAAINAHTTDMASWCSARADEVSRLPDTSYGRARQAAILEELLRRTSQQQSFLAALGFYASIPWWAWLAAWWRGVSGRGGPRGARPPS